MFYYRFCIELIIKKNPYWVFIEQFTENGIIVDGVSWVTCNVVVSREAGRGATSVLLH